MAEKKALPESMYFLISEDTEILGPFDKEGLKDEVEDHDSCYWIDDMKAFVVSYDGEKLVYQDIDIDEEPKADLVTSPHKQSL